MPIKGFAFRERVPSTAVYLPLSTFKKENAMAFAFEKLNVYQKAIDFADRICGITSDFPKSFYFLRDQLNRASLSISANIAEGNGRFTKNDRKHFFVIARGSVQECVPLLELAYRRGFLNQEVHETLKNDLEEISKMISGLVKGIDNRTK